MGSGYLYGREGYKDNEYQGRSRGFDQYGSRSRSTDRDMDSTYEDDGKYSSSNAHETLTRLASKLEKLLRTNAKPSLKLMIEEATRQAKEDEEKIKVEFLQSTSSGRYETMGHNMRMCKQSQPINDVQKRKTMI
ncbi:uncharacterized protein LOC111379346 [Olea europaea var. sylvestris]|uniref:uncharacterized protein LOC111379346 n=1 Tax=Olea europaea var. sylvestris TaxID=158386 RepID=UPI000C1CE27B|nr:uncharacterized protein LOC111379346 [Olea europaea var. sylvestris]